MEILTINIKIMKEEFMKKYIITILTLFFIIILSITGYFVYGSIKENKANDISTLKAKCEAEINYIGNNIILIMNEVNNISNTNTQIVSEEIEVNWNSIEIKVQELYSAWTSILIDLSTLNVNKENLLEFNDVLDKISKSIEDKNELETLVNSADLYNLLTKYALDFYNDNNKTSLLNTKSCILYSYAEMERENWSEAKNYISKAKNEFANVLNNQVNNINRIDIINKAYILINELEEDSNNMDRKIFLINYSNLIQELQSI